ncbi:MAG: hypothetical protein R3E14_08725 [Erythrobacter sp.]
MGFLIFAALAYAGGCFVCSALLVRLLPHSSSARLLRGNVVFVLTLPFLLLVEICLGLARLLLTLAAALNRVTTRAFETMSGRPRRRRVALYYGYGRTARRSRR